MKLYKYKNGKCNVCGKNIRRLREAENISQEELATILQLSGLDITQKTVSRIETGERVVPDFELLYFAKHFAVSFDELLFENNSP